MHSSLSTTTCVSRASTFLRGSCCNGVAGARSARAVPVRRVCVVAQVRAKNGDARGFVCVAAVCVCSLWCGCNVLQDSHISSFFGCCSRRLNRMRFGPLGRAAQHPPPPNPPPHQHRAPRAKNTRPSSSASRTS